MNLLYLGKIQTNNQPEGTRACEVNFDGRLIGVFLATDDLPGKLELADGARKGDLDGATRLALKAKAPSLQAYVEELFRAKEAEEKSLRRMRNKLRKQTLFATPGKKVQAVASPYCERVRSRIKEKYPEAVILNTLSEDEAFRHYVAKTA